MSMSKTFTLSPILFETEQKTSPGIPLNLEKFIVGFAVKNPRVIEATRDSLVRTLSEERTWAKERGHEVDRMPNWSRLQRTAQLLEVLGRISRKLQAAIKGHKNFLKTMIAEHPEIVKSSDKQREKNPSVVEYLQRYLAS